MRATRRCGEMADATDLKSVGLNGPCRFESGQRQSKFLALLTPAIEALFRDAPLLERAYIEQALRLFGPMAEHVATLTGGVTRAEAELLFDLLKDLRPQTTLEVGLGYGFSALVICEAANPRRHIVIDPHQTHYWGGKGLSRLREAGHSIEFYESTSFETLPELLKGGCLFDFAFVDGWHTFDYVFVDFFYIDKMLRDGGVIMFDDADWPSIRPVLRYIVTNLDYVVYRTLAVENSSDPLDVEHGLRGTCIALQKRSHRARDIFFHQPFH